MIDLGVGIVGEDRVGELLLATAAAELCQVPDQRLVVVARRADVARGMGRPREGIDAAAVSIEHSAREGGNADVADDDLGRVHLSPGFG